MTVTFPHLVPTYNNFTGPLLAMLLCLQTPYTSFSEAGVALEVQENERSMKKNQNITLALKRRLTSSTVN